MLALRAGSRRLAYSSSSQTSSKSTTLLQRALLSSTGGAPRPPTSAQPPPAATKAAPNAPPAAGAKGGAAPPPTPPSSEGLGLGTAVGMVALAGGVAVTGYYYVLADEKEKAQIEGYVAQAKALVGLDGASEKPVAAAPAAKAGAMEGSNKVGKLLHDVKEGAAHATEEVKGQLKRVSGGKGICVECGVGVRCACIIFILNKMVWSCRMRSNMNEKPYRANIKTHTHTHTHTHKHIPTCERRRPRRHGTWRTRWRRRWSTPWRP
jgi:hypothetical protein